MHNLTLRLIHLATYLHVKVLRSLSIHDGRRNLSYQANHKLSLTMTNRTNSEWAAAISDNQNHRALHGQERSALGEANANRISPFNLARLIDHTALKPETTEAQIDQLCEEVKKYNFKVSKTL